MVIFKSTLVVASSFFGRTINIDMEMSGGL